MSARKLIRCGLAAAIGLLCGACVSAAIGFLAYLALWLPENPTAQWLTYGTALIAGAAAAIVIFFVIAGRDSD